MSMRTLLITGGCGFIGSHFVRLIMHETNYHVINLDLLTYAGNLANVADIAENPRYRFVQGSICDPVVVRELMREVDGVIHFAAESHVDNSIQHPDIFVETNVLGTQVLLTAARDAGIQKFVHISTDEVYGSLPLDSGAAFTEHTPLAPRSPYSASKAGSDLLCMAAYATYGFPVVLSRCSNNFGTYQLPEKLIPMTITRALRDQNIPIYGDGKNIRDWLHVEDHCRAILLLLEQGTVGEVYNVGGGVEVSNNELVRMLLRLLDKPESLITYVPDRLGHDRRYSMDETKIRTTLGWAPRYTDFEKALAEVVGWYRDGSC